MEYSDRILIMLETLNENPEEFNAESLGMSQNKFEDAAIALNESGYICGVWIEENFFNDYSVEIEDPELTPRGALYLESMRAAKAIQKICRKLK